MNTEEHLLGLYTGIYAIRLHLPCIDGIPQL